MKIQTKSGFVCEVDKKTVTSWKFFDLLCDTESDSDMVKMKASRDIIKLVLGDEGTAALAEHVAKKNGYDDSAMVFEEFKEIITLVGEESKKSVTSQS